MGKNASELNQLINNFCLKKIIGTEELNVLINNHFQTEQEINIIYEKKQKEKSEKWTRIIAIIAIIVSAFVSIAICFFNYKTSSKEMDVYLKNDSIINMPLDVNIKNYDDIIELLQVLIEKNTSDIENRKAEYPTSAPATNSR